MSAKKNGKQKTAAPEEIPQDAASAADSQEAVIEAVSPAVPLEEHEAVKKQLEESQAKVSEYLDGWQRTQAEFSNYKKRIERDQSLTQQMIRAEVVKRYLPVLDDIERALQNRPADPTAAEWANGVELIYRKLKSILETEGVKRIEAEGQMFDPNFHEAIAQEPSDDHESGQVISVIQHGYMLGDRVIRHALVRVAQ